MLNNDVTRSPKHPRSKVTIDLDTMLTKTSRSEGDQQEQCVVSWASCEQQSIMPLEAVALLDPLQLTCPSVLNHATGG
jgi:hypothetical protein